MGKRTILVDDLDQQEHPDIETRHFVVGHQAYTIDLSAKNYEQFLKDMEKWMNAAEPVKEVRNAGPIRKARAANGTGTPKRTVTQKGNTAQEVREWLRENNFGHLAKSDRGRLSTEAIERWDDATEHSDNKYTGA